MKIAFEIYQKSNGKSVNTVRVEYAGKTYHLDPDKVKEKAKMVAFISTATLVIIAVGHQAKNIKKTDVKDTIDQTMEAATEKISGIVTEVKEKVDEKVLKEKYQNELVEIMEKFDRETSVSRADSDAYHTALAEQCKRSDRIFLAACIKRFGPYSQNINTIIRKMTGNDHVVCTSLEDYLQHQGYESYEDFDKACMSDFEKQLEIKNKAISESKNKEDVKTETIIEINNETLVEQPEENSIKTNTDDSIAWVRTILDSQNPAVEVYKAYQQYGDSDEMNDIITKVTFMDKETYATNLEEYVVTRGFNSMDEWKAYCYSEIVKDKEERGMQL